jgi:flagellar biosynthesis component FlhA
MVELLFNVVLVLSAVITPLSTLLLSTLFYRQKIASFLVKLLLVLLQKASNLFDGFPSCLDLVVFVHSMNSALRADWIVAGEAKISEFFFNVIRAGILKLISAFFGIGRI